MNILRLLGLLLIPFTGLLFIVGYTSGPPAGKTGSPGDGGAYCTQCHSLTNNYNPTVTLTSNIPAQGYTPGQTYQLTLSVSSASSKHGFEMTAEDASNQKVGTFQSADSYTQTLSNDRYIEHTTNGTTQTSWTFNWTAPTTGHGTITFYAAVNATNANNSTSGDTPVRFSASFNENTTAVAETHIEGVRLYPNPAGNEIWIGNLRNVEIKRLQIYDLKGKIIRDIPSPAFQIDLSSLKSGIYIIKIKTDQKEGIYRLIKK